jgi:hypothetical protein
MAVEELRAADVDRERVVERLRRAQAEGRIDLFEFDERVAAAYAARTYADLTPLTGDLPDPESESASRPARSTPSARPVSPAWPAPPAWLVPPAWTGSGAWWGAWPASAGWPVRSARPGGGGRRDGWAVARRIQLVCWLFASVLNVAIWAAVSLGNGGGVYPWWVWVVGPWGVMLLLERLVSKAVRCH